MNWQSTDMAHEMNFWAGRDGTFPIPPKRQILASFETAATMNNWLNTLDTLEAQGLRGVVGIFFVTWVNGNDGLAGNYAPLEAVADACIARNRWPNNPFP